MMKIYRRSGYRNFLAGASALALGFVMFAAAPALAAPQYDLKCVDCHTMPPLDSAAGTREPATGAVKGNHQGHADSTPASCAKCHGGEVTSYAAAHRDKTIQVSGNINNSPAVGQYSRVGFFNQSTVPPVGSCSNVNCHFESRTPAWGADPSATSCGTYHEAQPSTASHGKHISYLGGGTGACAVCHPARTGFSHATSAGSRGIQLSVSPSYSGDGQSYSGSGQNFLPSQSGSRSYGSCSSVNCHNDGRGQADSQKPTPVWGTVDSDCAVCHARRPATGSHQPHLNSAGIGCGSCHNSAVEATTAPAGHINGVIDVYKSAPGDLGYPAAKAKGSAYANCTNASCHNDGKGSPVVSGTWGTPSADRCGACHASHPATGSHSAHFDAGFSDCSRCHKGAIDGSAPSEQHVNGVIDVYNTTPGDMGYPQAKAYNTPGASCTTGSCHDDGRGNSVTSPQWGTHVANCSACHATRPATGTHTSHMNAGLTCTNCHKGAVEGSTPPVEHLDGNVDVYKSSPGDLGYPRDKAKGSAFTSCSASACHGTLSKTWGISTNNYQCTKCHGQGTAFANFSTANYKQAAPGYGGTGVGTGQQTGTVSGTGGVSSDPKVGAHDTHLRVLNRLGKPVSCNDCHTVPATAFGGVHMNGIIDMVWSNLVQNRETTPGSGIPYTNAQGPLAPAFSESTSQCSNTYCHGATLPGGNNKNPSWTDATYLTGDRAHDCAQCHGYPPTTSNKYPHQATDTVCSSCHPHDGNRDSTDPLLGNDLHINGNLEATNHCNTCHDYDTRQLPDGSYTWGKNQMAVEGFGAHAMHINYLKTRMNAAGLDPNADSFGQGYARAVCGTCHTNDATQHEQSNRQALRKITFGDSSSVRRQFGPSLPHYNGVTGVSSATTLKTCSNIDCHYKNSPIWQPF